MIAKLEANIPFTKEAMMEELKEILFIQASQIAVVLDSDEASRFLGVEIESWNDTLHDDDRQKIDLKRFNIRRVLDRAYDYAFQTGAYWQYDGDDDYELDAFNRGVTPFSFEGTRSPFLADDSKVRHVAEMALARRELEKGWGISIRGLSLLAGMTEPAVRNSLSKEGIQTQGKPASVESETALKWLSERRGFIPTQREEAETKSREQHVDFLLGYHEFPAALAAIVNATPGFDLQQASVVTKIPQDLIQGMINGDKNTLEIDVLQRLGSQLNVPDVPKFVAKAIEHALRSQSKD
ncbi:hypothetical protein [Pseudorhizobium flavum]|uniref:hypothetical protein n=1 Tax=Pseudorhizobium flavum TaxID=1335061 RepID=UPI00376F6362